LLLAGSYRFSYTEVAEVQPARSQVARKDKRAYIDILFFLDRRRTSSSISNIGTDSNRKPGLRLNA
jgi:hypothetical protein